MTALENACAHLQEWEKACKGWESNIFSYGDRFDSNHCLVNGEYVFSGKENVYLHMVSLV